MARGWESKEVESQIDAAEERRALARKAQHTAEQVKLESERESLQLSRRRVVHDLEAATHAGYQAILRQSLQFLDDKLAALEPANKPDLPG